MDINWQQTEAVAVCVAALATLFNVAFFVYYLKLTRGIHRAVVEQAEGQSKPVIVVACQYTLPADGREWLEESIPTEIEGDKVRLANVGNGPAFNLRWTYERKGGVVKGECAYLPPGERFVFPIAVEVGAGEKRVECEYASRGGSKYVSTTMLRDRYVVSSRFIAT